MKIPRQGSRIDAVKDAQANTKTESPQPCQLSPTRPDPYHRLQGKTWSTCLDSRRLLLGRERGKHLAPAFEATVVLLPLENRVASSVATWLIQCFGAGPATDITSLAILDLQRILVSENVTRSRRRYSENVEKNHIDYLKIICSLGSLRP